MTSFKGFRPFWIRVNILCNKPQCCLFAFKIYNNGLYLSICLYDWHLWCLWLFCNFVVFSISNNMFKHWAPLCLFFFPNLTVDYLGVLEWVVLTNSLSHWVSSLLTPPMPLHALNIFFQVLLHIRNSFFNISKRCWCYKKKNFKHTPYSLLLYGRIFVVEGVHSQTQSSWRTMDWNVLGEPK